MSPEKQHPNPGRTETKKRLTPDDVKAQVARIAAARGIPDPDPVPELPIPKLFLTAEEAFKFLGLDSKAALRYLHELPDPPPYIPISTRRKSYDVEALIAWAKNRLTTGK
jgi:hypothetical protein